MEPEYPQAPGRPAPVWLRWAPTLLALLLLLLALGVGPFGPWRRPGAGAGAGEPAEVERAVRQVLDEQVAAWNRGDLEGFMSGYWASPELSFFSGDTRTRGWEATLERYRKRYPSEEKRGRLAFRDVEVEVLGPDGAVVRGRYELVRRDDRPTGLFTVVFKRLPEGWRIVHDHTSTREKK